MPLQIVNPLEIPNWDDLVLATGRASFFHSSAWARVLHESYGYKPMYFASFENGNLSCLMPFMEVNSWLTGKRGVSLPFTDQCTAIVPNSEVFQSTVKQIIDYGQGAGWRYIEWRDGKHFTKDTRSSEHYYTHELDLRKTEKELFSGLRDSTRRNIKRADKSGVSVQISQSSDSMVSFYRLNCITRQRHGLPPQPFSFFERALEHVISKGHGFVASGIHSGQVIASAVFFHFGKGAIYKYGASDPQYQEVRANNLVMWEAITACKAQGLEAFDFGRTESENDGLLQFKRGWGATENRLHYYKYDLSKGCFLASRPRHACFCKAFRLMPSPVLKIAGNVLYKHAG